MDRPVPQCTSPGGQAQGSAGAEFNWADEEKASLEKRCHRAGVQLSQGYNPFSFWWLCIGIIFCVCPAWVLCSRQLSVRAAQVFVLSVQLSKCNGMSGRSVGLICFGTEKCGNFIPCSSFLTTRPRTSHCSEWQQPEAIHKGGISACNNHNYMK